MKLHCQIYNRRAQSWQDVFARNYALVLVYWLGITRPQWPLPEDLKPLVVYQIGPPIPAPSNPDFLMLVVAAAEAETGRTPPVELAVPDAPGYEACCQQLVDWLCVKGCIRDVTVHADDDHSKEHEVAERIIREARGGS